MQEQHKTIVEEWAAVQVPPPPALSAVTVDPATTALLVLDIQQGNCNAESRPRCVAMLPGVADLLSRAREAGMLVGYALIRGGTAADIRAEVAPQGDEPVVASGVDKFYNTRLEEILKEAGIETVILVGTAAHGAVLHTATGAALRGLNVIVPVDGMASDVAYAEQYTAWHLANAPGTRRNATLTRIADIQMG